MAKYRVIRPVTTKRGSRIYKGVYEEVTLPEYIRTNRNVCLPLADAVVITKQKENEPLVISQSKIDKESVKADSSTTLVIKDSSKVVNLNTASKEDLVALPGIGEVTADRIINSRPVRDVKDIKQLIKDDSKLDYSLLKT